MTNHPATKRGISTRAIHAGGRSIEGAVVTPVFRSSTYQYRGESYHDHGYLRLSNTPNHRVVCEKIADLEGTESAVLTGSGMAAISTTMLTFLAPGDAVLTHNSMYGGTLALFDNDLARLGIERVAVDACEPRSWPDPAPPKTRAFFVETISNPLLDVADLDLLSAYCRKHEILLIVDNTFASPINSTPAARGADLVIESCSKYMNGHSDIVAGSVAGSAELVARVKLALDHYGGCLDTSATWLLERGLKTLPVRVRRQTETAAVLAGWLEEQPCFDRVRHPSLASHPQHAVARAQLAGFGAMIAAEFGGNDPAGRADVFLSHLGIFTVALSLGGVESLAIHPAEADGGSGHLAPGVRPGMIRLSVGLEDVEDLIDDLRTALIGSRPSA